MEKDTVYTYTSPTTLVPRNSFPLNLRMTFVSRNCSERNRLKIPLLSAAAQSGLYSSRKRHLRHQLMDRHLINNNYYCGVQTSCTAENRASEMEILLLVLAFPESPVLPWDPRLHSSLCHSAHENQASYVSFPKHFLRGLERQCIFGLN